MPQVERIAHLQWLTQVSLLVPEGTLTAKLQQEYLLKCRMWQLEVLSNRMRLQINLRHGKIKQEPNLLNNQFLEIKRTKIKRKRRIRARWSNKTSSLLWSRLRILEMDRQVVQANTKSNSNLRRTLSLIIMRLLLCRSHCLLLQLEKIWNHKQWLKMLRHLDQIQSKKNRTSNKVMSRRRNNSKMRFHNKILQMLRPPQLLKRKSNQASRDQRVSSRLPRKKTSKRSKTQQPKIKNNNKR